jgi:hypothetical protein
MGHGRWNASDYSARVTEASTKTREELYGRISKDCATKSGQRVNVEEIEFRESRDSDTNPLSTPNIVGLDVTGSMGIIPERMTKGALGTYVEQLLQRKPITDPHICFLGIGDATQHDRAPLQATQFEATTVVCDQLQDLWLEGAGGGNHFESYDLAWAFAVGKVRSDAWDKRKAKGMLFTIGDEQFPGHSNVDYIGKRVYGQVDENATPESLLKAAQERYNCHHIIIAEGSYASRRLDEVEATWQEHLHRRALTLHDYHKVGELLVAATAVEAGTDLDEVLSWWDSATAEVVGRAFRQ